MYDYGLCLSIKRFILKRSAEVMVYTNWDSEFAANEIKEIPAIIDKVYQGAKINPNNLTKQQCTNLGFSQYEEIFLIPLWLFPFLTEEVNLLSINGEKITNKSQMSTDNRAGNMAYGIKFTEQTKGNQNV